VEALGDLVRLWYITSAALIFCLMFRLLVHAPKHYPMPASRKWGFTSQATGALGCAVAGIVKWGSPFTFTQLFFVAFLVETIVALTLVGRDREDFFKDV
jgi:multidrug transporter EmrE-like cation transporter